MATLATRLCGIEIDSPFVLASGPPGWDAEGLIACAKAGAGAVVTKSIGYEGAVNATRHMASPAPGTLINNEGGSDESLAFWLREVPKAKAGGVKCLIASLSGLLDIAGCVDIGNQMAAGGADILEVVVDYHNAGDLVERIKTVKQAAAVPVLVKVNANWSDTTEIARLCADAGADGITAIDSIGPTMRINTETCRPMLGGKGYGYLTGAPLLPFALRYVYDIAAQKPAGVDLVGTGGVLSGRDAVEILMAGANCVGVCTLAILKGPQAFKRLCRDLSDELDRLGYGSAEEVVALTQRAGPNRDVAAADFTFDAALCNRCGRCVDVCPYRARALTQTGNEVDSKLCRVCGLCATACPKKALVL